MNVGIVKGFYLDAKFNFSLPSVCKLTERLSTLGPNTLHWGADLARAYRQLRVCLLSTSLLGVSLDNKFYIDIQLPFGCHTSALACTRTTCAVVWLLRQEGFYALCYLDDFVGLEVT